MNFSVVIYLWGVCLKLVISSNKCFYDFFPFTQSLSDVSLFSCYGVLSIDYAAAVILFSLAVLPENIKWVETCFSLALLDEEKGVDF